jgi:hypothetical protein
LRDYRVTWWTSDVAGLLSECSASERMHADRSTASAFRALPTPRSKPTLAASLDAAAKPRFADLPRCFADLPDQGSGGG